MVSTLVLIALVLGDTAIAAVCARAMAKEDYRSGVQLAFGVLVVTSLIVIGILTVGEL